MLRRRALRRDGGACRPARAGARGTPAPLAESAANRGVRKRRGRTPAPATRVRRAAAEAPASPQPLVQRAAQRPLAIRGVTVAARRHVRSVRTALRLWRATPAQQRAGPGHPPGTAPGPLLRTRRPAPQRATPASRGAIGLRARPGAARGARQAQPPPPLHRAAPAPARRRGLRAGAPPERRLDRDAGAAPGTRAACASYGTARCAAPPPRRRTATRRRAARARRRRRRRRAQRRRWRR